MEIKLFILWVQSSFLMAAERVPVFKVQRKPSASHKQGKDPALSGFEEESERKRHRPITARGPEWEGEFPANRRSSPAPFPSCPMGAACVAESPAPCSSCPEGAAGVCPLSPAPCLDWQAVGELPPSQQDQKFVGPFVRCVCQVKAWGLGCPGRCRGIRGWWQARRHCVFRLPLGSRPANVSGAGLGNGKPRLPCELIGWRCCHSALSPALLLFNFWADWVNLLLGNCKSRLTHRWTDWMTVLSVHVKSRLPRSLAFRRLADLAVIHPAAFPFMVPPQFVVVLLLLHTHSPWTSSPYFIHFFKFYFTFVFFSFIYFIIFYFYFILFYISLYFIYFLLLFSFILYFLLFIFSYHFLLFSVSFFSFLFFF